MDVKVNITSELDMKVASVDGLIALVTPNVSQTVDSSDYHDLNNKPSINGVTLVGDKTSKELYLYGENNPETFTYEQKSPLDKWTIKHPLNKYPSCTVVDSAGTQVMGEVTYLDKENLTIQFSAAFSGICYLN